VTFEQQEAMRHWTVLLTLVCRECFISIEAALCFYWRGRPWTRL